MTVTPLSDASLRLDRQIQRIARADQGVLITGDSGVGKSELGLELISRGHGLVADDVVDVSRIGSDTLEGRCPELLLNKVTEVENMFCCLVELGRARTEAIRSRPLQSASRPYSPGSPARRLDAAKQTPVLLHAPQP